MLDKIKEILGSVRFWMVTGTAATAFLADVAASGFSLAHLLLAISAWLATIAGLGTLDSVATKFGAALRK